MASVNSISVFTLNEWALPYFLGTDKEIRLNALGKYLFYQNYDVVCLQELWSEHDYNLLKSITKDKLPYGHYFLNGIFGSGLCILSKWPIVKTFFIPWSLNGYFHMIHHGDWFGGKGVALATIQFNGMTVNIFNVHLIANYDKKDRYIVHRIIQALDLALFLNISSNDADISIVCGDFNAPPNSVSTELIKKIGQVEDSINSINKHSYEFFGTNSTFKNTYSSYDAINSESNGVRIDYILYKSRHNYKVRCTDYDLPLLMKKIPGINKSYSDHEAVEANFCVIRKEISDNKEQCLTKNNEENFTYELCEAFNICCSGEQMQINNCCIFSIWAIICFLFFILNPFSIPFLNGFIFIIALYLLFMSTIWHCLEINAIRSAKKRIDVLRTAKALQKQ